MEFSKYESFWLAASYFPFQYGNGPVKKPPYMSFAICRVFFLKPHRKHEILEHWQNIIKAWHRQGLQYIIIIKTASIVHLLGIAGDIFPGDGSHQRVFHRRASSGNKDEMCLDMLGRSDMLGELLTQWWHDTIKTSSAEQCHDTILTINRRTK